MCGCECGCVWFIYEFLFIARVQLYFGLLNCNRCIADNDSANNRQFATQGTCIQPSLHLFLSITYHLYAWFDGFFYPSCIRSLRLFRRSLLALLFSYGKPSK